MAADVEEGVDLARAVAHHQHRVLTHIGRKEVTRLRDLALVAQKEPAARENPLLLLFVDLRLNKDAAADQTAIGIDQTTDIGSHVTLLSAPFTVIPAQAHYCPGFCSGLGSLESEASLRVRRTQ